MVSCDHANIWSEYNTIQPAPHKVHSPLWSCISSLVGAGLFEREVMSVSVIIPAHNEEERLNTTISNIFRTASGDIEVIVVLQGYFQIVDPRAQTISSDQNVGERKAMNWAVKASKHSHILRIDAHCDFSPIGWDVMMEKATGPMDMTQAVLTATDKDWKRIPGHRYERCRLLPSMEAKWEKPNREGEDHPMVMPNMSSTGCGMMWRRKWYDLIGGADETLPPMGAIGEEFSVKTWLMGGKVQTHTGVMIGHIFGTGAYDTSGVLDARAGLVRRFGPRYPEIRAKFEGLAWEETEGLKPTAKFSDGTRIVTIDREDRTDVCGKDKQFSHMLIEHYRYKWIDNGTESHLTDDEICQKYKAQAVKIGQQTAIYNNNGQLIDTITGALITKPDNVHDHTIIGDHDASTDQDTARA